MKGPFNLMKENWLSGEVETGTLCEWLMDIKAKMAEMAKIVTSREVQAKSDMKRFYDQSAREKVFDLGDMVLVRRLGLHSKLSDAWEGPFQVGMQVSPVTYSILVPGRATAKVLHANLMKKWRSLYIG